MVIEGIEITVIRKRIRNLYIRIKPPRGDVVVSAPNSMTEAQIRAFVLSRMEWIKEHRRKYEGYLEKSYAFGESVRLWGEDYVLARGESNMVSGRFIFLKKDGKAYYDRFCRSLLQEKLEERVPLWEERTGLHAREWRIRDMSTRWGSCNITERRIWISLRLIEYPLCCLDQVMVHELCHLLEKGHGAEFKGLMDRFYPDWRAVRKLLR